MLEVRNLTKFFGRKAALSGLTFNLEPGICFVVGPNGAGKTTLLRTLIGAAKPSDGSVVLDGIDVFNEPLRAWRHMSYLSDAVPLYNDLSVEEHLEYRGRLKGLSGIRLRARLRHVIEALDLKNLATVRNAALSAGQRKRVGIADALLCETRVLLIDEPFAGLDREHVDPLCNELALVAKHANVLLATHDIETATKMAGNALVLYEGHLAGILPLEPQAESFCRQYDACIKDAKIAEASK